MIKFNLIFFFWQAGPKRASQTHLRRVKLNHADITVWYPELFYDAIEVSLREFLIPRQRVTSCRFSSPTLLLSKRNYCLSLLKVFKSMYSFGFVRNERLGYKKHGIWDFSNAVSVFATFAYWIRIIANLKLLTGFWTNLHALRQLRRNLSSVVFWKII